MADFLRNQLEKIRLCCSQGLFFLREIIKLYNGNLNNLKGDYVMATEEIKKIEED